MIFRINCINGKNFYYDNQLNRVYDYFGNLIDFSFDFNAFYSKSADSKLSLKSLEYLQYNAETTVKKTNKVFNVENTHRLEITLGYRCNYRCKYCIQHNMHKEIGEPFNFNLFCKRFEKSGIFPQIYDMKFTGGEPFVYFDRLKKFVSYFRDTLGYKGRIQLVTNGELFDKEKLEFCLKNNLYVYFSHDAFAQTFYRHKTDYLEDPETKSLVIEQLKAKQISFGESRSGSLNFTLNPKVYTLESALDFFNENVYSGVPVSMVLPIKCDRGTEFLLNDWTQEHLESATNSFLHAMLCDESDKYYPYYVRFREVVERIMYRIVNRVSAGSLMSRCPVQVSSHILPIDYNGNVIACWAAIHNKRIVDGQIDNLENVRFNFKSLKDYPECNSCPYLVACGCACPILLDKQDHAIRCKSLTPLIKAEVIAAFSVLLKTRVKEIIPCAL